MEAQKVLVVDDSPTDLHLITGYLLNNGYTAMSASTGEEALEKVNADKPDLILMDVVMPGLNGFQATRQLTKGADTAHIPIVIVTTKDQETDRVWGKRQGAKDYLTKPVDEDVLLQTVDRMLADS